MEHYYNTDNEAGTVLQESNAKAARQENIILEYLKENRDKFFSPEEIHYTLITEGKLHPRVPLTSVRRALTNLHSEDRIIRTHISKLGGFGKYVHTYRYDPSHD